MGLRSSNHNDEPLIPWKEVATQSIDRTEALEAERDNLRAENERWRETVRQYRDEIDREHAENQQLRAALIAGRATHGELCHAGSECQFIRDANAALGSPKDG